jgi:hypothetical protein
MTPRLVLPAAWLLLAAASAPPWFPQADGTPEPDLSLHLHLPRGPTLALDFVRFKPKAGLSDAAVPAWCGVVLHRPGAPAQALVTLGTGRTALLTCDGLAQAGAAKLRDGRSVIALVFNSSTPGGVTTTPVVLARDQAGNFHVDDDIVTAVPRHVDLAGLRAALARAQ